MWWFGIFGIYHSAGRRSRVTLVRYNFGVKIHHVLRHLPPVCSDGISSKVCAVFFALICGGTPTCFACLFHLYETFFHRLTDGQEDREKSNV